MLCLRIGNLSCDEVVSKFYEGRLLPGQKHIADRAMLSNQ